MKGLYEEDFSEGSVTVNRKELTKQEEDIRELNLTCYLTTEAV